MSDIARPIRKLSFSEFDEQLMWKEKGRTICAAVFRICLSTGNSPHEEKQR
jgi:hypothetical protein